MIIILTYSYINNNNNNSKLNANNTTINNNNNVDNNNNQRPLTFALTVMHCRQKNWNVDLKTTITCECLIWREIRVYRVVFLELTINC